MEEIKKNKRDLVNGLDRPVVVILGLIKFENKILLINRNKEPYIGKWGLVGGKLELDETLQEGMLREVKEETGLICDFVKFNCVEHKRMYGEKDRAFVAFYCTLNAKNKDFVSSDEGELEWFEKLPYDIIKADKCLIDNFSDKEIKVPEIVVEDEKEFRWLN